MATKRVLVIDDEPDMRTVVQGCLEDLAGWDVRTAASGPEGLIQIRDNPPDAIVLDIMMPGMDGFAFLKALRDQQQGLSIPVVLLTAKITVSRTQVFSELAVEGVISKPFDPFLLANQIADFLGWNMED